jgi:hypothetical protein
MDINISTFAKNRQGEKKSPEEKLPNIEKCITACKEKLNQILSKILKEKNQEAHKVEASILKQLMELGFLLLQMYFANHNQGDYGETIETAKGTAVRRRTSEKSYFSIFGKLKVSRYLYHIQNESFAPLDIVLNLPVRCYSYFLSEFSNLLNINGAYDDSSKLLKKFFGVNLSVSALETISSESPVLYENYYAQKDRFAKPENEKELTKNVPVKPEDEKNLIVTSFDCKGVPMVKKEAEKIKARLGKGKKRQKKKDALVGVKYNINANVRTPEEIATNLVFPEKREKKEKKEGSKELKKVEKPKDIRYIVSIEQPKKEVMEEIKKEIKDENFEHSPLVCVMDGAKYLWRIFGEVFKEVKNKVLILDIIHVLEYIWLIAHVKYKEGSNEVIQYVYEKLLFILQGKVASYIMELQTEMLTGHWKKSQSKTFSKVITYFKNHKQYMKYDQYLARGYHIGSGVVESACSHVVKDRMEISGARWGIDGAEAILKLRSIVKSNDWDEYWKFFTEEAKNNEFLTEGANLLISQERKAA